MPALTGSLDAVHVAVVEVVQMHSSLLSFISLIHCRDTVNMLSYPPSPIRHHSPYSPLLRPALRPTSSDLLLPVSHRRLARSAIYDPASMAMDLASSSIRAGLSGVGMGLGRRNSLVGAELAHRDHVHAVNNAMTRERAREVEMVAAQQSERRATRRAVRNMHALGAAQLAQEEAYHEMQMAGSRRRRMSMDNAITSEAIQRANIAAALDAEEEYNAAQEDALFDPLLAASGLDRYMGIGSGRFTPVVASRGLPYSY